MPIAAVAAVAGVGVAYNSGQEQKKASEASMNQARKNALKQEKSSDEANNRVNQKSADTTGALAAAQQAGKSGASGTMLTGTQGVDQSALNLGKSTLLGM